MPRVTACAVPEGSLLAEFGGPQDYRDCFAREVPGTVTLEAYIERFYCSMAFRPERLVLGLLGRGASNADAKALARGEADGIAVWKVVARRQREILLESKGTGTASWLAVESLGDASSSSAAIGQTTTTRLRFGSWVGSLDQSAWRFMALPHVLYSRVLLGGV
jgi:hypothetical protein